ARGPPRRSRARSRASPRARARAARLPSRSFAVRRDADDLAEGREPLGQAAHRRLAQALCALDAAGVGDLVGVAALGDQAADAAPYVEHFEDGGAAEEARLAALGAALAPAHAQAVAPLDRHLEAERRDLVGVQRALDGAALADAPDQPLRDDAAQHAREQ